MLELKINAYFHFNLLTHVFTIDETFLGQSEAVMYIQKNLCHHLLFQVANSSGVGKSLNHCLFCFFAFR